MASNPSHMYSRLLLTGAAGGLGRVLRPRLKARCDVLRVSDLGDLGTATAGEEVMPAPLQDRPAVFKLLEGVDAVIHLGGISTEQPFDDIVQANIIGTYHLYEAARHTAHAALCLPAPTTSLGFIAKMKWSMPTCPFALMATTA